MIDEILKTTEVKMEKCITSLHNEFVTMRAGKITPSVLDKVRVDYYSTPTPIEQIAAVSVQEGRNIIIAPWDKSQLKVIEKAIQIAELGVNPQNDGNVIRLCFPQLNEEERKKLSKEVSKYAEEQKIAVRNVRRDAMDKVKKAEKDKLITEDDRHDAEDKVQKVTDKFIKKIEEMEKSKISDIMEI